VTDARPAAVVILAAGEGTRMRSATTPKVLHPLCGRTMLGHVVAAARALQPEHLVVVVGHSRERVTAHLAEIDPGTTTVVQEQQLGTGHAVRVALDVLDDLEGTILVLPGDAPLLRTETLGALVGDHVAAAAATTLLTTVLTDPAGYGRVVRGADGAVLEVVEHKDADDATLRIDEVATGVYAFDAAALREALGRLTSDNAQGEQYLPDVVALQRGAGLVVAASIAPDPDEGYCVNDRVQLAEAARLLRDRVVARHQRAGVTVVDPLTTWVDVQVQIAPDVTIGPGTQLHGRTTLAAGAEIGPDATLTDTAVGEGAVVVKAHCHGAVIGARAMVGPYTYLRPGTVLKQGAKAGAYVEIKASEVGEGSKVPHLSYVGDAVIGRDTNIGAATVFVNYDGRDKHRTTIGDDVRIGSDTMLVAPVEVGDGAYTAAGSVITQDVPPGALGVARGRQRNIEGWVARTRGPRTAHDAAHDDAGPPAGEQQ
jgi:bifunctional UDP-N-acetylglucosamine pyrophosphorylase/glucosamine-1-phosphate N-acetyltransferase